MDSSSSNTGTSNSEGGLVDDTENYITGAKKLAAILGRTTQTALKLIQSGKIVAVPIGGTYRIYESELRRFLKFGNHPNPQPLVLHKRGPQGEPDDVNNDA